MEEVGNIEVRKKSALIQKRPSFDLQGLLMQSDSPPPWLDKETGAGDWVDKHASVPGNDNSIGDWEGDGTALPDFFYRYLSDVGLNSDQQCFKNASRRKQSYDFDVRRNRSDDFDVATSDSSGADLLWQFNLPKVSGSVNGGGIKDQEAPTKASTEPRYKDPRRSGRHPTPSGFSAKRNMSSGKTSNAK